jgi:hypothetical protein
VERFTDPHRPQVIMQALSAIKARNIRLARSFTDFVNGREGPREIVMAASKQVADQSTKHLGPAHSDTVLKVAN